MLPGTIRWLVILFALVLVAYSPMSVGAGDDEPSDGADGRENGEVDDNGAREDGDGGGDGGGEQTVDPYAGAASTDDSVTVTITSMSWEVKKKGDKVVDNLLGEGTTTGDVDHCAYAIVLYYDDDSVTHEEFKPGPLQEEYEDYGSIYFGGKDSLDDWNSWKLEIKLEYEYREPQGDGEDEDAVEITEVVVYVRAYTNASDENGFNQASISKSVSVDGEGLATVDEKEKDDGDDDGVIPGFGSALLLLSMGVIGVVMILARRRR